MPDDPIKLLFAGPVGAGKTTALRTLSGAAAPVSTEVALSEGATSEKATTTVAFDYSTLQLDADTSLHLYGIPGQDHFDFMRPIIAQGALGAIILLDATSPTLGADCGHWTGSLRQANPQLQFVIGISKVDLAPQFSLAEVRQRLRQDQLMAPVLCIDPREEDACRQLVRALLAALEARYA